MAVLFTGLLFLPPVSHVMVISLVHQTKLEMKGCLSPFLYNELGLTMV